MKEELLSVGIDIGTSTTQLIFSKLIVENMASSFSVPRISIVDKEIIYKSEVYFTPLISNTEIDRDKIKELVELEYKKANICKSDIQTGAVIITGETARKENANDVLHSLSGFAGDFVVATAGPDLESIISGKGAGAHIYSKEHSTSVVNLDIGGGTTNLALFKRGEVCDTGCLDIGGRLIKIDKSTKEIIYISPKIKEIIKNNNLNLVNKDFYFFQLITNQSMYFLKDEREIYNFSVEFIDRNIERLFLLDNGYRILSLYENLRDFILSRERLIKINNEKNIEILKSFLHNEMHNTDSEYDYNFCNDLLIKLKLLRNITKLINLLVLKFDKKLLNISCDRCIDEIKNVLLILEIDCPIDFEIVDNLCLRTNVSNIEQESYEKIENIPKETKYTLLKNLSTLSIELTFDIGTSSLDDNSIFSNILVGIEDKRLIVNSIQKISKEFIELEEKIKEELRKLN